MEPAENLRLDGNAAAGLLSEVFGPEATGAMARCGGCGTEGEVGALMVYMYGMGAVLRCPHCDHVLIRITHIRNEVLLDMQGAGFLRLRADT